MDVAAIKKAEAEITLAPVEAGQIAVVVVAPGEGIARVFASLGVAAIVAGGQTMNPSTLEILNAFKDLPTDKIVILPNNKNIILAAQSAAQAAAQANLQKSVSIIPSRTVPQGLAAMLRLVPDGDLEAVVAEMNAALNEVETGEITTATRSVEIDGVAVEEGQIIALHNGKLILGANSVEDAVLGFLKAAKTEERELITLFSGANIPRSDVDNMLAIIQETYPDQEVELQDGGQPHYHFIIAIE
jgi:dihydroxyacetone kinase-like predicted kinase